MEESRELQIRIYKPDLVAKIQKVRYLMDRMSTINRISMEISKIKQYQVVKELRIGITRRLSLVNSCEENVIKVKISIIK